MEETIIGNDTDRIAPIPQKLSIDWEEETNRQLAKQQQARIDAVIKLKEPFSSIMKSDAGKSLSYIDVIKALFPHASDNAGNGHGYMNIIRKVERLSIETGLSPITILSDAIFNDDIYAQVTIFQKPVTKTNWQERYQYETIHRQSQYITKLKNLDTNYKTCNVLWVSDGVLMNVHPNNNMKSVDFVGSLTGTGQTIAIAAKYTDKDGGGQDDQANDLESFAIEAPPLSRKNMLVILLADGKYYTKHKQRYVDCADFFTYVQHVYRDKNVIACTTEDVDIAINDYLNRTSQSKTGERPVK